MGDFEGRPVFMECVGVLDAADDAATVTPPHGVAEGAGAVGNGVGDDAVDERFRWDSDLRWMMIRKVSASFKMLLFTMEAQGVDNVDARPHKTLVILQCDTAGATVKVG
jgi:hypothetical protein